MNFKYTLSLKIIRIVNYCSANNHEYILISVNISIFCWVSATCLSNLLNDWIIVEFRGRGWGIEDPIVAMLIILMPWWAYSLGNSFFPRGGAFYLDICLTLSFFPEEKVCLFSFWYGFWSCTASFDFYRTTLWWTLNGF